MISRWETCFDSIYECHTQKGQNVRKATKFSSNGLVQYMNVYICIVFSTNSKQSKTDSKHF